MPIAPAAITLALAELIDRRHAVLDLDGGPGPLRVKDAAPA
ncbi:hypothetical protein EDD30_6804 [Couchioplanes caeruleus]|uniref:Uncharacterized protein n=1 Tax=Couchioplanes caeruleus TaxID=56438 RepID=A0A3N1GU84_9ACTN|nr:hypothetical protein EDD30_6804 [Couchioplanes caeruleus]